VPSSAAIQWRFLLCRRAAKAWKKKVPLPHAIIGVAASIAIAGFAQTDGLLWRLLASGSDYACM
jgi:hypothetical protein